MNCMNLLETLHSSSNAPTFLLYEEPMSNRSAYTVAILGTAELGNAFAQDITDSKEAALNFLYLLYREDVSPHHLADILEDSLPLR